MFVKNIYVNETSKYIFQLEDSPCVINLLYSNGDPAIEANYICPDNKNIKIYISTLSSSLSIEVMKEYIKQLEHFSRCKCYSRIIINTEKIDNKSFSNLLSSQLYYVNENEYHKTLLLFC